LPELHQCIPIFVIQENALLHSLRRQPPPIPKKATNTISLGGQAEILFPFYGKNVSKFPNPGYDLD